jgi:hypothetical protein
VFTDPFDGQSGTRVPGGLAELFAALDKCWERGELPQRFLNG